MPSASPSVEAAGRTTSASCAVAVRKRSCTTRWSRPVEQPHGARLVGLALRRVLADHVDARAATPCSIASNISVRCLPFRGGTSTPHAASKRARTASSSSELEPRQPVRQRAHVTAALHVVLPAQRLEARAVAADVTGEERQVDEREDVVDGVVVLGDPERPAELCAAGVRVGVRELADRVGRNAGDALRLLERPRLDRLAVRLVAGRRALDELGVREAGVDDLARHRVRERDVGADVEPEPEVGPLRRGRAARVDDHQLRAACARPSARGGRRSGAPRARSSPRGRSGPRFGSPRRSSYRRLHRTPSPDRRRWARVRFGYSCRCCWSAGRRGRTSARRS